MGILKKPGRQSGAMTITPVLPSVSCGTQATPARSLGTSARERQHVGTVPGGLPRAPAPTSAPPGLANPRGTGTTVRLSISRPPGAPPPLPLLLARAYSLPLPYLAFSSASTARRSTVLKRFFMARASVATAVLSVADPTQHRYASAHARWVSIYGSPDDPIFLKAKVRLLNPPPQKIYIFVNSYSIRFSLC